MIDPFLKQPPNDPQEAAYWWSARRHLGLLSDREEVAFQKWLDAPTHAAAWSATEAILEGASSFASEPEIRAMRNAALAVPRQRSRRGRWMYAPAVAAAMALAIWLGATQAPQLAPTLDEVAASERYAATAGHRREIILSDGSHVTLDSGSLVDVAFTAGRRSVRLVRGQALFHVAKDAGRPFIVAAGDRYVTAVGTVFDVRLDPGGLVKVLLVEGHVTVEPIRATGLARIVPAIAREELSAGEALTAGPGNAPTVVPADVVKGTSWSHGQLIFRNEPLSAVVTELNRYTTLPVVVPDNRVARIPVSGVFSTDRADGVADLIAAAYSLRVFRGGGDAVVLESTQEKVPAKK